MNQKKQSTQQMKNLNRVIKIDETQIHSHLDEMVRDTVEETINKMLDAEADRLCNAQRYEHTESRADTRAGSYRRKLKTKAGVVNLKVPRLRKATLETVIIERYRRRKSSVEEALIQMYLAGVSLPQRPPADASEEVKAAYREQHTVIGPKNRRTRAETRRERKKRDILSPGDML